MTNQTAALSSEYQKVFPTKADKVAGRRCVTCDSPLVFGSTFTATNDFRTWDNYCATCAASTADQVKSLFVRLVATGADVTEMADVITAYAQGETVATFTAAKVALRDALAIAAQAHLLDASVIKSGRYEALGVSLKIDNVTSGKWAGWVFVKDGATGDRVGKQRPGGRYEGGAEEALREIIAIAAEGDAPLPEVATGLYVLGADVLRVYRTGNARLGCRRYDGTTFVYTPGGVRKVATALAAGEAYPMTDAEASAWGAQVGRCFNCISIGRPGHLSDDRSLAVGYGERCAEIHGWWYPTAEQAHDILRGGATPDFHGHAH